MDVERKILKHLARDAHSTAPVIDEYCLEYKADGVTFKARM
jgi:hypothetical protein